MTISTAARFGVAIALVAMLGMSVFSQGTAKGLLRRLAEATHDEPVTFQDDGTLVIGHAHHEDQTCRYFTDVPGKPKYDLPREIKALHYHFKDCYEQQLGTRLGEHFTHQLLADIAGIPYSMTCGFPDQGRQRQIFEHRNFTAQSVLKHLEVINHIGKVNPMIEKWTVKDLCTKCNALSWWCPAGPQYIDTREQMWKVADPNVQPSDAIIHLRLGDALSGTKDRGVGLLPFRSYLRILKQAANLKQTEIKTIGIVTQSFDSKFTRVHDSNMVAKSRLVMAHFSEFLKKEFPAATINIYNEGIHTPLDAYSRIMKAKVATICGASTFCTYPTLANKDGIGYLFASEKYAPWTVNAIPHYTNMKSFKAPRLANNYIEQLSNEQLVHWLKEQSPDSEEVISAPPLVREPKPVVTETSLSDN